MPKAAVSPAHEPPRFAALSKQALADVVAARIRGAILGGDYPPGALLPTERELAVQFGVNRTTLREALHAVEHLGLVERRQGVGCRVLDYRESGSLELLRYLVMPGESGRFDLRAAAEAADLVEALMGVVVQRACAGRRPGDVALLRALASELSAALAGGETAVAAAVMARLFRGVIRASHAVVLELTGNALLRALDTELGPAGSTLRGLAEEGRANPRSLGALRALVEAIDRGDAPRAVRAAKRVTSLLRAVLARRSA